MKIKWLRQALRNLEQVQEYLADYNPETSRETIKKIQSALSQFADYPLMGREGRVAGTREL
jgi:toxin ParE1/3/4